MARTHSILRAEAPRLVDPGRVLERVNELLVPEMPARMFVTCLYGVLEPATGRFVFANAGHNLPYVRSAGGVTELRATGLPLGLMPGVATTRPRARSRPATRMLLSSDGLVEAHGPGREMYGFPRLREAMAAERSGQRAGRPPARRAARLHRPRLGAGGRHHARHPPPDGGHRTRGLVRGPARGPAHPRRGGVDRRRRAAARVHDPGRDRQRARRDAPGRGGGRPAGPGAAPAGAPQDRGRRDGDERDRVRLAGPSGDPGRRAGRGATPRRSASWSRTAPSPAPSPTSRRRTSRRSSRDARSHAAGACSSSATWSTRWT